MTEQIYEPLGAGELIPGTALPLVPPGAAAQAEGRGDVMITRDRMPVSTLERVGDPAGLDPLERAFVNAALRAYDKQPKLERVIFDQIVIQTDGTTGNCAAELYECPQGYEGHVAFVTADTPLKSTVTPTAPAANAAIWNYLSILPASSGRGTAPPAAELTAGALRNGLVDFVPNPASTTGPALPAKYGPYGDDGGPIVWGGKSLWFVLVGGSQASVINCAVKVNYRVNLYQRGLIA